MKFLFNAKSRFFFYLFFLALITSCTKEEEIKNDSITDVQILNKLVNSNNTEYASFKDGKELLDFALAFDRLEAENQETFLSKLKYKTRPEEYQSIAAGIDNLQTRDQIVDYVSKHKSILKIKTQKDGIEKVTENGMSAHYLNTFINKDGLLKVGEYFHKYLLDYVIYGKDLHQLQNIIDEEAMKRSGLKYEKVVEHIDSKSITNRDDLDVIFAQTQTNENSGCKNDRRIEFSLAMKRELFSDINGFKVYHFNRESKVKALRRGIPCLWYSYSTPITWNNCNFTGFFTFSLDGSTVPTSFTANNVTINTSEITRNGFVFANVPIGSNNNITFTWTNKRTSATHQGMAGAWIENY